jgi:hypothetical protein
VNNHESGQLTELMAKVTRLETLVEEQIKAVTALVQSFSRSQEACSQRHKLLDSQIMKLREFDAFSKGRCTGISELSARTYVRLGVMVAIISALATVGQYVVMKTGTSLQSPEQRQSYRPTHRMFYTTPVTPAVNQPEKERK